MSAVIATVKVIPNGRSPVAGRLSISPAVMGLIGVEFGDRVDYVLEDGKIVIRKSEASA